jgi:hypothetical protein
VRAVAELSSRGLPVAFFGHDDQDAVDPDTGDMLLAAFAVLGNPDAGAVRDREVASLVAGDAVLTENDAGP